MSIIERAPEVLPGIGSPSGASCSAADLLLEQIDERRTSSTCLATLVVCGRNAEGEVILTGLAGSVERFELLDALRGAGCVDDDMSDAQDIAVVRLGLGRPAPLCLLVIENLQSLVSQIWHRNSFFMRIGIEMVHRSKSG